MNYQPGDVLFINYGEQPPVYHTRVILSVVDHSSQEYIILTPDHDIYCEMLSLRNADIQSLHPAGANGSIPPDVPGPQVYGFQPMTPAQLAQFMQAGRDEAVVERNLRGIQPGPVAGGERFWVLAEHVEGKCIGDQVSPPPGTPVLGSYGLMEMTDSKQKTRPCLIRQLTAEELGAFCDERIILARSSTAKEGEELSSSDDIRTMAVHYTANGERRRGFKNAVGEMVATEIDEFPFEPRTCLEYLKAISTVAESSYGQHLAWVQQARIPDGSRAIYEDEVLSQILDTAICYDCLQVSNLASFELLVRRKQLLAEAHSYNPASPSFEGADYWMGNKFKHGGAIVVPSLTEHVSKKLQADSQILKERRKLEEAKGRGRGRGNPQGGPRDKKTTGAEQG